MKTTHYKKIKDNRITQFFKAATIPVKIISIGAIVLSILLIGVALSQYSITKRTKLSSTPTYETLTPAKKSIQSLGGWKKLTPPSGSPFYTFSDTVTGIPISVSQQQLPDNFKNDPEGQTAQLAKSYNAISELTVGSTRVHIGDSAKGPQSLIFTKDSLLVLIQSQNKISDEAWIAYITDLK
jgi:hypothetical protein